LTLQTGFEALWCFWFSANQARRQDLAAGGPKTRRRGQKPERAIFLKYSIGCM